MQQAPREDPAELRALIARIAAAKNAPPQTMQQDAMSNEMSTPVEPMADGRMQDGNMPMAPLPAPPPEPAAPPMQNVQGMAPNNMGVMPNSDRPVNDYISKMSAPIPSRGSGVPGQSPFASLIAPALSYGDPGSPEAGPGATMDDELRFGNNITNIDNKLMDGNVSRQKLIAALTGGGGSPGLAARGAQAMNNEMSAAPAPNAMSRFQGLTEGAKKIVMDLLNNRDASAAQQARDK